MQSTALQNYLQTKIILVFVCRRHGDIHHGQHRKYECLNKTYEQAQNHKWQWNQVWNQAAENSEYCVVCGNVNHQTNGQCNRTKNCTDGFNADEKNLEQEKRKVKRE